MEESREEKLARAKAMQEKKKEEFRAFLTTPAHTFEHTIEHQCLQSTLTFDLFKDHTATATGHHGYNNLFLKIPAEIVYEGESYSVTEIADNAFKGITAHIISLPKTLKKIGASSFEAISELTSISLPHGVEYVGKDAFAFCPDLSDVQLPYSIIDIGDGAFMCCSISHPILPKKMTLTGKHIFVHNPLEQLVVPLGVKNLDTLIDKITLVTQISLPKGFDITDLGEYNIVSHLFY